jgi:hypothetical protein
LQSLTDLRQEWRALAAKSGGAIVEVETRNHRRLRGAARDSQNAATADRHGLSWLDHCAVS